MVNDSMKKSLMAFQNNNIFKDIPKEYPPQSFIIHYSSLIKFEFILKICVHFIKYRGTKRNWSIFDLEKEELLDEN